MIIKRFGMLLLILATMGLPDMTLAAGDPEPSTKYLRLANVARDEVKEAVEAETARLGHVRHGRIWCVPFARAVSGINIKGDAGTWWKQAGAAYPRSHQPIAGAVLNFRSTKQMPRGHVAVVSKVISPRAILIDHANWVRNKITLDNVVIDVSEANDWSAVRVANSQNSFGRVYPTYGFIYPAEAGNL